MPTLARTPVPRPTRVLDGLAGLVGGRCAICRAWCRGALCAACAGRFIPRLSRCPGCAIAMPRSPRLAAPHAPHASHATRCARCLASPPAWSGALAGFDYAPPWNTLVRAFKFEARLDLAAVLVPPLSRAIAQGDDDASRRLVVPVPLAPDRLRERGYNQAWEVARRVARVHGARACADALFRVRDTGHQLRLARGARAANLRDAFVVSPDRRARVAGARIALVDDVLTTGATAEAAVRALRAAGAEDVSLWVLARTP